jgi:hypothetical protein
MEELLHQVDAALAALPDAEIERRWRHALAAGENALVFVLGRQLVLRALPVIEQTIELHARTVALEPRDRERLIGEAAIKLLLRLLHDSSWRSVSGLAATTTQRVVAAPSPTRAPVWFLQRPRLRLVGRNEPIEQKRNGGGEKR